MGVSVFLRACPQVRYVVYWARETMKKTAFAPCAKFNVTPKRRYRALPIVLNHSLANMILKRSGATMFHRENPPSILTPRRSRKAVLSCWHVACLGDEFHIFLQD